MRVVHNILLINTMLTISRQRSISFLHPWLSVTKSWWASCTSVLPQHLAFQEPTDLFNLCFAFLGILELQYTTRNSQFPVCWIFCIPLLGPFCPNPNKTDRAFDHQEEDYDPDLHDCGRHHRNLHRAQLSRDSLEKIPRLPSTRPDQAGLLL